MAVVAYGLPLTALLGLVVGVYGLRTRERRVRLISLAVLVSPLATLISLPYFLDQQNNWWISYAWPAVAFPLILIAVLTERDQLMLLVFCVLGMLTATLVGGIYRSAETLIFTRTVQLLFLAGGVFLSRERTNWLVAGLLLFYGLGGFFFILRTAQAPGGEVPYLLMRAAQLGGLVCLLPWIRQSSIRSRSSSSRSAPSLSVISPTSMSPPMRQKIAGSGS